MAARSQNGKNQSHTENSTPSSFQQGEVEVRKKTRLRTLQMMADALRNLEDVPQQFSKPFGGKDDDILWPANLYLSRSVWVR